MLKSYHKGGYIMTTIYTSNLLDCVSIQARLSDEIIIISGYFSIDVLEKIAKLGIPTTFYYGMYLRNGLSYSKFREFERLEIAYPNFKIKIPLDHYVHTKCYVFKKSGRIFYSLVGSANTSNSGLEGLKNSELLSAVDVSIIDNEIFLNNLITEIDNNSESFNIPLITTTLSKGPRVMPPKTARSKHLPASWNNYSGNPFSAIIPLYYVKKDKPLVHNVDGLNWGNGPHSSKSSDMEAVIPIRKFHIDHYPSLIPYNGSVGSGTGGKIQRMQNPINMIWDDGTHMTMLFQQDGVQVPPKSKRKPGDAYRTYPKALTASSGGVELGVYFRKRLGLAPNSIVTYEDLRNYGRDYVTLTLTNADTYELDFSV